MKRALSKRLTSFYWFYPVTTMYIQKPYHLLMSLLSMTRRCCMSAANGHQKKQEAQKREIVWARRAIIWKSDTRCSLDRPYGHPTIAFVCSIRLNCIGDGEPVLNFLDFEEALHLIVKAASALIDVAVAVAFCMFAAQVNLHAGFYEFNRPRTPRELL